ncbi:hypothetical protein NDU88_003964 [Pleurodeles waltl]|uniref:Uncharacterized protein n=1 Tax=Pleurodeles waltl TaxID=8319 RepID=A0AAV7V3X5_PLEWA|nr:hypothetical protein NDU88_003964 [Pleurodeles waltl]
MPRPFTVRQAGVREHPPQALQGTLQPGFTKPDLGLRHGGPNQPPTRGPEASLQTRKPLPGPAGPRPSIFATHQGRGQSPGKGFPPWFLPQPSLGPTAWPGPLNPKQQGKPAFAQCTPRPSRVRQAGGVCSLGSLSLTLASGMGAQTNLRPGALRPLYTPGNPYQDQRDPVLAYLPPIRAEDKAQARGSHPGSCHSPVLGPTAWPGPLNPKQQGKPAFAQCTPRPSRVRQAGGREHPPQALGCQFALWEARFGGETHRTGLQGGLTPGRPRWALQCPVPEPLDPKGVQNSRSLVIRK